MTSPTRPRTRQTTSRRLGSDVGATAVEYALLVAGVALVMIVGVAFLGASVGGGVATAAEALSGTAAGVDDGTSGSDDKAAADKAAADKAAADKAAADKAAADKAAADKAAADKAAADKAAIKDCAKNKNFVWNNSTGTCEKIPGKDDGKGNH